MADSSENEAPRLSLLDCPICCLKQTDPKVLPCGHSFCKPCVDKLLQSYPASCPICRTSLTVRSTDNLPTNFTLKSLSENVDQASDTNVKFRLFGDCSVHKKTCDQFCRTCERQICEDCVEDKHGEPDEHDIAPVGAIITQQTEAIDATMAELLTISEQLAEITRFTSTAEEKCEAQITDLFTEITDAVKVTNREANDEETNLKQAVLEGRKYICQNLDSMNRVHSEVTLLTDYAKDLCLSFRQDLQVANVSKMNAFKSVSQKKAKIIKVLAHLEDMKNVFINEVDLQFQSQSNASYVGKLVSCKPLVSKAKQLKTISLKASGNIYSCGFIWPQVYWMIFISCSKNGKINFVQFENFHFLIKDFSHEMGIGKCWHAVTPNTNSDGRSILCLSLNQVHKFTLPTIDTIENGGEVVSTFFALPDIIGISWDEKLNGCYALLGDGQKILHLDIENNKVLGEVLQLPEKVKLTSYTHILHVSVDGSMAICDQGNKVIRFYQSLHVDQSCTVKAPEEFKKGVPWCVCRRREDKLWYVLWFDASKNVAMMFAYDRSFELVGKIMETENKTVKTAQLIHGFSFVTSSSPSLSFGESVQAVSMSSSPPQPIKASFCFQGENLAVQLDKSVFVYYLG